MKKLLSAFALSVTVFASACADARGPADCQPRIEQGWIRLLPGGMPMHGGFARIGRSKDATAIAMQRGGSVADVWVISDGPVDHTSLLPGDSTRFARSKPGVLPSRAGDNLFWLGRYVERADFLARLVEATVRLIPGVLGNIEATRAQ